MDGFLLVDKPAGISSFGVVVRVRRVLSEAAGRKIKVGHTGTLDPAATGLMILVIGSYCKKASFFSKLDKTYEAELTLGAESSTADSEGEIKPVASKRPSLDEITAVLAEFAGEIEQIPPAFSAVKIGGQRAYKLARAGKEVKIEPRKVFIREITDITYDYPRLRFSVDVSSGTYIRSLAQDIGKELGTGAYLSALRRTKINHFSLNDALNLEGLTIKVIQSALKQGLPEGAISATISVTDDN